MLLRYLYTKRSWIVIFLCLIAVTDVLIVIDQGFTIEMTSLFYLNGILFFIFFMFLLYRYKKETKYMKELSKLNLNIDLDWIESLPEPNNELEKIVNKLLIQTTYQYKRQLADYKENQLIENDFITSWIHEIKTPLTTMRLLLNVDQNRVDLRKLENEWLRMHLLIDRQLHMTRLPSLSADYLLEQVSLKQLIIAEIQELSPWCIEKKLEIKVEGNDTIVVTDKKWCRFIIRQIFTNAIKYSPINKTIYFRADINKNNHVILDIIDEGPGIKSHDLPRVFDKGFTGENGRIHNAATGLGLYLAQTVAEKLGILLDVKSINGSGTTLRMIFSNSNSFDDIRKEMDDLNKLKQPS